MNPWGFFIAAVGVILVIAAHKNAQGALLNAVTGKASPANQPAPPGPAPGQPGSGVPPPVGPAAPPTPGQPTGFVGAPVTFNGLTPADAGSLV